jgi:uncharacterized protein
VEVQADTTGIEHAMSEQIGRWDELEQALLELDDSAMVLEELDGFIAGVLVCPETIPPGEWFARAVGLSSSQASPFTGIDHANDVLDLVMEYYNDVATTLERHPARYQPRHVVDDVDGDVIWELWIDGFAASVDLRPDAWKSVLEAGDVPEVAMAAMMALIEIARAQERPREEDSSEQGLKVAEETKAFSNNAPAIIQQAIITLHTHRLATYQPLSFADQPNPFAYAPKVGRNDPCPCGSGRKYKRCCGAN